MLNQRYTTHEAVQFTETQRRRKTDDPWRGKTLGRYRLQAFLGQGTMGLVYIGHDLVLQRLAAVKVFNRKMLKGQRCWELEQFIREARAAALVEHPNIVNIYEICEQGGYYFIAMELLDGDLQSEVHLNGPLPYWRACQLLAEACDGIAHAHEMGIIHRDLKPSNLMITRKRRCKVIDFGLARTTNASDLFGLPTEAVGTALYAAPEVIQGQAAQPRADIYSLAATLWFLLVGQPPFTAATEKEILIKHVQAPLPDLRKLRPGLPDGLVDTINRGLAKDPIDRFENARAFAAALRLYERLRATDRDGQPTDETESPHESPLVSIPPRRRGLNLFT